MITLLPCENVTHDLMLDFIGSMQESQRESSHGLMKSSVVLEQGSHEISRVITRP